jgi:hypothetical protein
MRRMNRFQYNNAVVDLARYAYIFSLPESVMRVGYFNPASETMPEVADVKRPLWKITTHLTTLEVWSLPQDPLTEHGFDNRGRSPHNISAL